MTQEQKDTVYPVKSLHDFLFELDKEWGKFRNGTLISLCTSAFLFLLVFWLILRARILHYGFLDFTLLIAVGAVLGYSIYAMVSQYRFFSRWERRVGLLLHLEDNMLKRLEDPKV
jgi:hypothetical protein